MALIVEDGTNVAGANSYADLATLRTYALNRGVTLSVTDSVVEAQAFNSMDFIESFRFRFQGVKTYQAPNNTPQALQFPRSLYRDSGTGIYIDCIQIDNNVIPQQLIDIECQCVMAVEAGVDFANLTQEQKFIIKEEVGPIKVTYADAEQGGGEASIPYISSIQNMLDVLFFACGNGYNFHVVRV